MSDDPKQPAPAPPPPEPAPQAVGMDQAIRGIRPSSPWPYRRPPKSPNPGTGKEK